jgi:hypothetical protein|tara:strand:+ start:6593 stop:7165 length:573 start_codon:yes stop_codon:yes gene_type:complete
MKKIAQKLSTIQTSINVKKENDNPMGWKYRKIDDILETVKPHLAPNKCSFHFNEEYIHYDQFPVIKVTAYLTCTESGEQVSATGIAGVGLNQRGMQVPQQFGSAGTYARKYAAGNLFLFDENTDPDSQDNSNVKPQLTKSHPKFQEIVEWLHKDIKDKSDVDKMKWIKEHFELDALLFDELMLLINNKSK